MIRLLIDRVTLALLLGLVVMALVAAAEPSRPEILLEATTKTVQPVSAQAAGMGCRPAQCRKAARCWSCPRPTMAARPPSPSRAPAASPETRRTK
jgi:hypothetical protein